MDSRFQYLALLAICLAGTAFLEVRFDARIWRRPLRVARALALPWVIFNIANEIAVFRHLWFYNPAYVTGLRVPKKYPIEELVFFVAIPLCALLTFEAANAVYSGRVVPPWSRAGRRLPSPVLGTSSAPERFRPAASAIAGTVAAVGVGLLVLAALSEVRHDPAVRATARREYAIFSQYFDWQLRDYTILAVMLLAAVLLLELAWWRTGVLRMRAYWVTIAICLVFMVPVNGWLTKLSAPIVIYAADEFSGWRPVWDIPLEDFGFGIALLTLVLMSWVRELGRIPSRTLAESIVAEAGA